MSRNKLKILGVCGGNGVILYPIRRYVIGNIEDRGVFKTDKNLQWYMNFKVPFVDDLMVAKFLFSSPDIIIGAPDCGHSSILGNTGKKKKKARTTAVENSSVRMFFQSIIDYKPKIWIMENLPALLNQITMSDLKEQFPEYRLIFHTMSMAELGNSQKTRKRLIIIALQKDLPAELFMAFSDVEKQNEPKTVGELLSDLKEDNPKNGNIREKSSKKIKMGKKSFTFGEIQEGWLGKKLSKEKYWPLDLDKIDSPYIPGVYRLFEDNYPQTIRQDPRQFRPDGLPLSPRELARIQGIPDRFKLYIPEDSTKESYYINKARITVAKGAPYELGLWLRSKIKICKKYL